MMTSAINYFQVLTPQDECAKHGRDHMAVMLHEKGGGAYVTDEQGNTTVIAEATDPVYVCVACLMQQIKDWRERAILAKGRCVAKHVSESGTCLEVKDPRARWDVEVARRLRGSGGEDE